ncbi:hypothetical protein FOZ62_018919, partial [Perkinsus olseni]
ITQKVSGCPCDLVHISPILARANDGSKGDRVRQALVGSGVTLAVSKDADIGNKKRKVGSTVRYVRPSLIAIAWCGIGGFAPVVNDPVENFWNAEPQFYDSYGIIALRAAAWPVQ